MYKQGLQVIYKKRSYTINVDNNDDWRYEREGSI